MRPQEFDRPYRAADYFDAAKTPPITVDAFQAAAIKLDDDAAEFHIAGRRVYPKPLQGIFALWPRSSLAGGETAPETELHRTAKATLAAVIDERGWVEVQPVHRRSAYRRGKPIRLSVLAHRVEAPIARPRGRKMLQPDLLALVGASEWGRWVAFEIRNTHRADYRKRRLLKQQTIATLEIDVRGFLKHRLIWPEDELRAALLQWFRGCFDAQLITAPRPEVFRSDSDRDLRRSIGIE